MIENVIQKLLSENALLSEVLCKYDGAPAVFYGDVPNAQDECWEDGCHPRIYFGVDWTKEQERKVAGTMMLNIFCNNESDMLPEDIAETIKTDLSEVFLKDDTMYCMVWERTDGFEMSGEEPKEIGVTMTFSVLDFTAVTLGIPCPIKGTMEYLKENVPEVSVIGMDSFDQIHKLTDDEAVTFVRLASESADKRQSYSVRWFDTVMHIHVIAKSHVMRMRYISKINRLLEMDQEVILEDKSPMFVEKISISAGADMLKVGQITINGRYGILRKDSEDPILMNATVTERRMADGT